MRQLRFKLVRQWRAGSKNWVWYKTKVAGFGTVALPNRQADSGAGGSGAAAAEWPGPVRYGASAHNAHEFNEEFNDNSFKYSINSQKFSRYSSQYSSDMIYNMISFLRSGQNPWYLAWFHEKLWVLVYQEVSRQRIHIRIHIWIDGKLWIHIWINEKSMISEVPRSVPSKNSYIWIHRYIHIHTFIYEFIYEYSF